METGAQKEVERKKESAACSRNEAQQRSCCCLALCLCYTGSTRCSTCWPASLASLPNLTDGRSRPELGTGGPVIGRLNRQPVPPRPPLPRSLCCRSVIRGRFTNVLSNRIGFLS